MQTLKGFRDFLPDQQRLRDHVTNIIKHTFEIFAFQPISTPTLEYASLLLGKYGPEADKLVYTFQDKGKRQVGLRYDQTVPTARFLTQHRHQLPTYFRRYQIQNVFRADKPQKGRFREFTQCDIDIFGTTSPLADADILATIYATYYNLGLKNIHLLINDRQLLHQTITPFTTPTLSVSAIIQTLDKLDKLTPTQVRHRLHHQGLSLSQIDNLFTTLDNLQPSPQLQQIITYAHQLGIPQTVLRFTPTLARGLDYYTGMIFEVVSPDFPVGSLAGGGRYDKLVANLGGPDIPAVGAAIGFDRTIEALTSLHLLPSSLQSTQVLVTILDSQFLSLALHLTTNLRHHHIATLLYPNPQDKITKQIKYALQLNIPYLIIIGENEARTNTFTLKHLPSHSQHTLPLTQLLDKLQSSSSTP